MLTGAASFIATDLAALTTQLNTLGASAEGATQQSRCSDMLIQARTEELVNAVVAELRKIVSAFTAEPDWPKQEAAAVHMELHTSKQPIMARVDEVRSAKLTLVQQVTDKFLEVNAAVGAVAAAGNGSILLAVVNS